MYMEWEKMEERTLVSLKRSSTPAFQNSDWNDAMTEVERKDEEPYMMPTKTGMKRNEGKGVERPVMPEQPIRNML